MMLAQALALANLSLAPALQAVGWALLHLVWQGTAIAVILALLLALLPSRSASVRYALSCAALALVVVVAVLTGLRSYESGAPAAASMGRAVHVPHVDATVAAPLRSPVQPTMAEIVVATFAPARVASLPDPWRAASAALPAIVMMWMAGVTLLSLRLVVQWLQARRLARTDAQPACEPWLAMAKRLATALGVRRAVRLVESTAVQIPAVIGLIRPVILLPANTLTGLLPGQLEMILAHELAHIRRHDFLVNLLQAAVETLLFYHPAVWWISRQVRIEREHCCDDLAVQVCGSPLQYARALTRLEELRAAPLPFALSANGGSLLHRIRRVVAGPAATAGPVRGVTALALLLGLLLAFAGPSLTAIAKPQTGTPAQARKTAVMARPAVTPAQPTEAGAGSTARANVDRTCADPVNDVSASSPDDAAIDAAADVAADAASEAAAQAASDAIRAGDEPVYQPNSAEAIAHGHIRLTVDELIALRSQGVTTTGILEMRSLFPAIDLRDIAGMYAVGATPDYIRQMNAAGMVARTPEEAKSMAAVGVTPEFLADMRAAGIPVKSASVACGLAAVGVTSEYIRGMRAAGFQITSADEAKSLAAVGVTPDYVREMRTSGLKFASASDLQSLAAVGVTSDYIRDMRAAGLPVTSADEARSLAAVGVTADYVREMRETGLKLESVSQLQSLAAVGVTADFVQSMRAAGVPLRDAKDAQSLAAMGVTPKFVRKLAKAGYTNLSVSDLCRLAAGGMTDSFVEEMSQYRTH